MPLTRRMLIGAGIAGLGGGGLMVRAQSAGALDLREFGAIGDGRTDDGPALRRALAALARRGGALRVPSGDFVIEDRSIVAGGVPYRLPPGATLTGDGPGSRLMFRRVAGAAFYGLTIDGSDIAVRDLTLAVDSRGSGWTAAVGIIAAAARLRFSGVMFTGTRVRGGHQGILPIDADLDDLVVERCGFRTLEFGFTRQTTDSSDHRGLRFLDCVASDCTEVFEFNAPGLSRGVTRRGSALLSDLTDDDGRPLIPRVRVGQAIRSPAFPPGTRVLAVGPGRSVRLDRPALTDSPPDRPTRVSAGSCSGGVVRNLRCSNIGQWAIGMAHCDNWDVSVQGADVQYELVHLEDGCRGIRVSVDGVRCNLSPGVVGSPKADNGMVHVSTGCRDVAVRFDDADLTQHRGALTNALCLQPGVMGTTGERRATDNVTVSGRVLLRAGTRAVTAYETGIHFDRLELRNVDPWSRADLMLRLPGCRMSGTVLVLNPETVLEAGYGASGRFDMVRAVN